MDEPLAVSIQQCAQLLGCSGKHVYELIKTDPTFPKPFKLGRSTRILLSDLHAWLADKSRMASEAWRAQHLTVT